MTQGSLQIYSCGKYLNWVEKNRPCNKATRNSKAKRPAAEI